MKASNKIYVSADPFGFMHAYDAENYPPDGEAYIRKDYLLDILHTEKECCKSARERRHFAWVIDKLNEI